ncbi:putative 3-hydroxybenzoate 6-monooxygenase [Rosa chinensis]|uniref:Putative 3-hydroxybenzoate 6-monooxygenase n=1 Tax=Rosa chinensis TaxID=74649 RepID=A0A2P6SAI2_ROSCH|nr:putative 3-hydroxybenzoate 6-monooxygenase [Rosa chinensis]
MDMAGDTREDVVIVGGGISGLATALALHRKGIRSLVLEKSKSLQATGGIVVHSNGWHALEQLGVAPYLRQTADPILSKEEMRCVRRTDLVNILAQNLPLNTVRYGSNVLSIELDPVTSYPVLQLQNGTSLNAKVVIGCDGVNSNITNLIGVKAPSRLNVMAVRSITIYPDGHKFGSEFKMIKKGDVTVGVIPMTTNQVYWFITGKYFSQEGFKISKSSKLIMNFSTESVKDFPSSIKEMVNNCWLEYLHFSEYIKYRSPWNILCTHFRVGTVTVAGDALHAMTPFIAQGGSAALEDAVVLARCLARKAVVDGPGEIGSKLMVEKAFDEYLKERKTRLLRLTIESTLLGKMEETSSKLIKLLYIVLMVVLFRNSFAHARYDCGKL